VANVPKKEAGEYNKLTLCLVFNNKKAVHRIELTLLRASFNFIIQVMLAYSYLLVTNRKIRYAIPVEKNIERR
jgi:hypothetical protein